MQQNFMLWILTIGLFVVMLGAAKKLYRNILLKHAEVLNKLDNVERVLVDIRDGTKNFYNEKRGVSRLHRRIPAKLKGCEEIFDIDNISYGGALLRTGRACKRDEIFDLEVFLPLYPQPITVRSKVLNTVAATDAGRDKPVFKVSMEFIEISPSDKEKLVETVDALNKKTRP